MLKEAVAYYHELLEDFELAEASRLALVESALRHAANDTLPDGLPVAL